MNRKQAIIVVGVVVLLGLLAVVLGLVLREEPDVPPDPLLVTSGPDAGVFVLEAGPEPDGGDAEAGGPGKTPGKTDPRVTKLVACCRVVANNAKSVADPMTRASMIQAASLCESSARAGQLEAVEGILQKYDVPCD